MSFSFSVSSNAPFTMSTSLNAHTRSHSQHPPALLSLQAHSFHPSTPPPPPSSAPGLDVAHYHSLIHAELVYLQQQQDTNRRMQYMLQQQMQLAHINHSASSLQARHPSPSPPLFNSPLPLSLPHAAALMSASASQATPLALTRPPSHAALPSVASSSPLSQPAFTPLTGRPSPMPDTAHRSSYQVAAWPGAPAHFGTSANNPSTAQHGSTTFASAGHMHSPIPHPHFHPHTQQQPFAPPPSAHPAVRYPHPYPATAQPTYYHTHPHVYAHPPAAQPLTEATSHFSYSNSRHASTQPHLHAPPASHAHVHPYSRPIPSHASGHRGLVLHPHPMLAFQPLFPHFSLPVPFHMPVHVHMGVQEDNKRAASAVAISSLRRQCVERKLKPTAASADEAMAAEAQEDVATCAVCLCDFSHGELSVLMPCSHPYHEACLMPWLAKHNTCPSCRYEVMTDDETYNRAVRIKQDRQRLEKERRAARQGQTGGPAAAQENGAGEGSDMEARMEAGSDEEDTMYDDSEEDEDGVEERERVHGEAAEDEEDEEDDSNDDYDDDDDEEEEEEDGATHIADNDSDVVEIAPPRSANHNRANPIVIDTDDEDDFKHSHDLSLASYPSIPSLPSTATTLSAWSHHSADSLPPPVVPLAPIVSCALCGEACVRGGVEAGGSMGGVLSTACCRVACHTVCVQRRGLAGWITASGELTCPSCRAHAA